MAAKFTSDEILVIRRMAMQGSCAVEIARALKRDPTSIRVKCRTNNIKLRRADTRNDPEDERAIRALAQQGWSAGAIGKQLGRPPQSIRVKACALGIRLRPPRGDDALEFRIDSKIKHALQRAAEQRGCHVNALLRAVLHQIVERNLVNGLLAAAVKPLQLESKRKAAVPVPKPDPIVETLPPALLPEIAAVVIEPPSFNVHPNGTPELNGFISFADGPGAKLQGIKPRLQ